MMMIMIVLNYKLCVDYAVSEANHTLNNPARENPSKYFTIFEVQAAVHRDRFS